MTIQMFHPSHPTWERGGGCLHGCPGTIFLSLGYPPRDKPGHKAITESVNKCKDMDEGVDESLKDMHESVNRNMYIALISRNDLRQRLDFRKFRR